MVTDPKSSEQVDTTPSGRPRRITNPAIGDVLTFVEATDETGGERLVLEIQLAPHGGNAMHVHLLQTESFRILEGELQVVVAGAQRTLRPGDEATVPPRTPHRFFSESDRPVTFRVTVIDPGRLEDGLRLLYGLGRDGKVTKGGIPTNMLMVALGSQLSDMYLASAPVWLQAAIFKPLAALGRALGYDKTLVGYLTAS